MPRQFKGVSHDQCQRLAAVEHVIVIERAERRTFRRVGVLIVLVIAGDVRAVGVVNDRDYARDCQRLRGINAHDAARSDGAGDHAAMEQAVLRILTGIAGLTGHFQASVDAVHRLAQRRGLSQGGCIGVH